MNQNTVRPAAILATLLLGFNFSPANAEPSSRIDTRGFDMSKPQDVAALYARIERKATDVCTLAASSWDLGRVTFIKRCAAAAVDDAVMNANVKALTALHQSRTQEASKVAQNRGE